jgi:glutaredoxin
MKGAVRRIVAEIYSKPDCHLCVEMKDTVLQARSVFDLEIHERNIEKNAEWNEKYKYEIPVLFINGRKAFKYRVTYDQLLTRLEREK